MSQKTTVLAPVHEAAGAQFTDFSGWKMPLKYASELDEHRAVRNGVGLFDLSHMGEIFVTGPQAVALLNTVLAGNFAPMKVGKAKYSMALNTQGGIVDDLIVYRLDEDRYLVVPNAGNAAAVAEVFFDHVADFDAEVQDHTDQLSLLGIQGPKAQQVVEGLAERVENPPLAEAARELGNYQVATIAWGDAEAILARTGYTGEDGFEIIVPNDDVTQLWHDTMEAGEPHGMMACGLASRDSLRLEAGMPLYGNELSTEINPFEAGLNPVVSFKKEENFIGRDALEPLRETGAARQLIGLTSDQRRAGRAGDAILVDGQEVGVITSGIPSPTLGHPVALGYVELDKLGGNKLEPGTDLQVQVRKKPLDFTVAAVPFYRAES